jgi:hypothetical protein
MSDPLLASQSTHSRDNVVRGNANRLVDIEDAIYRHAGSFHVRH